VFPFIYSRKGNHKINAFSIAKP